MKPIIFWISALFLIGSCSISGRLHRRAEVTLLSQPINSPSPEFGGSVDQHGDRFLFNRMDSSRTTMLLMESKQTDSKRSQVRRLAWSEGEAWYIDPFISPDGLTLLISSNQADPRIPKGYNIWISHRSSDVWADPTPLSLSINTPDDEIYSTMTNRGTIYFTRFSGKSANLFFSEPTAGGMYEAAVQVNLPIPDSIRVTNPAISPDESYLIFASNQLEGRSDADLYYSRRMGKNLWSTPVNLGSSVNTTYTEFAPAISPDNKWLYFTSERPGVVQSWPEGKRRPGDIYKIPLKSLHLSQ